MSNEPPFGLEGRDAWLYGKFARIFLWRLPARHRGMAVLTILVAGAWIVAFALRAAETAWVSALGALVTAVYVTPAAYLNLRFWQRGGYRP